MFNRLKKAVLVLWVATSLMSFTHPENGITGKQTFVLKFIALAEDVHQKYGIPVSVVLAQSMHESGIGSSELSRQANNYFGMKCKLAGEVGYYKHDDEPEESCFRVYHSAEESFTDYGRRISGNQIYRPVHKLAEEGVTDYKQWVLAIAKCGYATNPKYADIIIDIIEDNDLAKYDVARVQIQEASDIELVDLLTDGIEEINSRPQSYVLPKPSTIPQKVEESMPEPQSTYSELPEESTEFKLYAISASTHPLLIKPVKWTFANADIR